VFVPILSRYKRYKRLKSGRFRGCDVSGCRDFLDLSYICANDFSMEQSTEKQADGRWIFPKELEGIYSNEQLKYFIDEAETRLQDTISGLAKVRDRFYDIVNIIMVIIGVVSTILFTCSTLSSANRLFLTALLVYVCIVGIVAFFMLKYYYQYGPGMKPKNLAGDGIENWMKHYHADTSETSCLYSILEYKQEMMDLNQKEINRQLDSLRIITVALALSLVAAVVVLVVSII